MTDSRPGNKTPGVKFSVESDFQVKNKQFLRLEGKHKEKRNSKNSKKLFLNLLFSFSCFFLSVHRVTGFSWRTCPGAIQWPGTCPGCFQEQSRKYLFEKQRKRGSKQRKIRTIQIFLFEFFSNFVFPIFSLLDAKFAYF